MTSHIPSAPSSVFSFGFAVVRVLNVNAVPQLSDVCFFDVVALFILYFSSLYFNLGDFCWFTFKCTESSLLVLNPLMSPSRASLSL